MIKNKTAVLLVSAALLSTASFAENVRVKRLDGNSGGGAATSSANPVSSGASSEGNGGGENGRVRVQPSRRGGDDGRTRSSGPVGRDSGWRSGNDGRERGGSRVRVVPRSDAGGPRDHWSVTRNPAVIRNIHRQRRVEVVPDQYYWHRSGGVRYCHTYRRGAHWYGFYDGPRFYWTRYHSDRWWWFDGGAHRWLFWSDGHWWYPGPGGVTYVYVNNGYYPPNEASVSVSAPERVAPPDDQDEPESAGGSWTSPDGRRMVQSFGPRAEAFLYDASQSPARYLGYLGQSVDKVRFTGGGEGRPLKILVDFSDGTFSLFSADGRKLDGPPSAEAPAGAPATPPAAPPAHWTED